jgi:hypothetical protein
VKLLLRIDTSIRGRHTATAASPCVLRVAGGSLNQRLAGAIRESPTCTRRWAFFAPNTSAALDE